MREKGSPAGVGIISIIAVMFLLALAVFSVLTLTSARADLALTERGAESVAEYYVADSRAVELAAEFAAGIDDELVEALPISDMQELRIHLVRNADGGVDVLQWQVVLTQDFSEFPEDGLNLLHEETLDFLP